MTIYMMVMYMQLAAILCYLFLPSCRTLCAEHWQAQGAFVCCHCHWAVHCQAGPGSAATTHRKTPLSPLSHQPPWNCSLRICHHLCGTRHVRHDPNSSRRFRGNLGVHHVLGVGTRNTKRLCSLVELLLLPSRLASFWHFHHHVWAHQSDYSESITHGACPAGNVWTAISFLTKRRQSQGVWRLYNLFTSLSKLKRLNNAK